MFNTIRLPMKNFFFLSCFFLALSIHAQQTIVFPDSAYEVVPIEVFQTSDGGYLIVSNFWEYKGTSSPHHARPISIEFIKTDASGIEIWTKRLVKSDHGYVYKALLDQNDNLTLFASVTETTFCGLFGTTNGETYRIMRFDPFGNEILYVNLVADCNERFYDAIEVPGGFIVSGFRTDGTYHSFVAHVNTSGAILWKELSSYSGENRIADLGNIIYTTVGSGQSGLNLNQYNMQGQSIGSLNYPSSYSVGPVHDIKITQDGNFLVLYGIYDATTQTKLYELSKLSPAGAVLWQKQFFNHCFEIEERADQQLYLFKHSLLNSEIEINLLSTTGDSLSSTFYNDPRGVDARGLSIVANGIDYVATGSIGCCYNDSIVGSSDAALFAPSFLSNTFETPSFLSSVFPNPTDQMITILVPDQLAPSIQFELFDLTGKMVYMTSLTQQETTLQLPDDLNGFFVYQLKAKNKFSSGKLVINN